MRFHVEHAVWCPACGLFGLRARKRRRAERKAQDAAHIAWAANLAREVRRERAEAVYRATDNGLFAAMVDNGPNPVPWQVLLGEPAPEPALPREIRKPYPAVTLHNHTEDQPCGGTEGGCSVYPAGEQIITLYDEPTDAERRATWFNLPEGGPW